MDEQYDSKDVSRIPTLEDLLTLCRQLNKQGAEYVIVGGFAVIHHGFIRGTAGIDLLIPKDNANLERVKLGLDHLEDHVVRELSPNDLAQYSVVRIADEIVVDLLVDASGQTFEQLRDEIQPAEISGVKIPYLSPEGLLKTKQGIRPKDIQDRQFLSELLTKNK